MLGKRIALDLGTSTVRALVRGEPAAIEEPPLLGYLARGTIAWGSGAVRAGSSSGTRLVSPLRAGGIEDPEALQTYVTQLANRAIGRQRIFKPDAIATVHSLWSGKDRRLLLDIFAALGTRTAYLIDTPLAVAMGAGINPATSSGHLVADIGGRTIEVASLALEGRVAATTLERGAEDLADAIGATVAAAHGHEVSADVATALMRNVATAAPGRVRSAEVSLNSRGAGVEVGSEELAEVVAGHVRALAAAVREVLAATPPALVDDILGEGVILAGGGALLDGLADQLGRDLGLPVRVAEDPEWCGVRGAAAAFDSLDVLKRNFMYIR